MIGPHLTETNREKKWSLFSEHNAYRCAIFSGFGLDADNVAAQAQGAVLGAADSGIIELDLQFGLQLRTVIEINQRAMKAQIPDHGLFFKGHSSVSEAGDHGPEMRVAAQAFAHGGNYNVQIAVA